MKKIDFNCDMGEGLGNEAYIMPFISSCNIACGGHAGDRESMENTLIQAKIHGVKAGVHPSYPDKNNFGRKIFPISDHDLQQSLIQQIRALENIAQQLQISLHHIKFHGALYHQASRNPDTAKLMVEMVKNNFSPYILYVPYPSLIANLAQKAGLEIRYEVFADRHYTADYLLVSRNLPDSLILDHQAVMEHVEIILKENKIKTISGELLPVRADTLCLHRDNPHAVSLAPAIQKKILQEGFVIQ